jgi:hypothetical protein
VSTKRDSENKDEDTATGGFGIGAKSAWANHKEFIVTSITDKKRVYRCFLKDTDQIEAEGFYDIVSEEETEEPKGLEIKIPTTKENAINDSSWENDFSFYEQAYIRTTHFWSLQPELVGVKTCVQYPNKKAKLSGSGWWIFDKGNSVVDGPAAIVDGIPYPIDVNQFKDSKIKKALSKTIYISFDAKQVPVAPNREQLRYTKKCKELVIEKFEEVINNIKNGIEKEINSKQSFREAVCYVNSEVAHKSLIGEIAGSFKWNDIKIPTTEICAESSWLDEAVLLKAQYNDEEILFERVQTIPYSLTDLVLVNDSEKKPSNSRLKTFFLKNKHVKHCYVVTLNSAKEQVRFNQLFNLQNYIWSFTSKIEKTTLKKKMGDGTNSSKLNVVRYSIVNGYVHANGEKIKIKDLKGSYFVETVRNKVINKNDSVYPSNSLFKYVVSLVPNQVVYGVPTRMLCQCKDMINAFEYVEKNYSQKNTKDYAIYQCYISEMSKDYFNTINNETFIHALLKEQTISKDSALKTFLVIREDIKKHVKKFKDQVEDYRKLIGDDKFYKEIENDVNQYKNSPNYNICGKLCREIHNKYPLLTHLSIGYYSSPPVKKIIDYINMCDNYQIMKEKMKQ